MLLQTTIYVHWRYIRLDATIDDNIALLEIYWAVTLCRMMYIAPDDICTLEIYYIGLDVTVEKKLDWCT